MSGQSTFYSTCMYEAFLLSEFVHVPCKMITGQTTGHNACVRVTSLMSLLPYSSEKVLIGLKLPNDWT